MHDPIRHYTALGHTHEDVDSRVWMADRVMSNKYNSERDDYFTDRDDSNN
jgi:hypothetical protein